MHAKRDFFTAPAVVVRPASPAALLTRSEIEFSGACDARSAKGFPRSFCSRVAGAPGLGILKVTPSGPTLRIRAAGQSAETVSASRICLGVGREGDGRAGPLGSAPDPLRIRVVPRRALNVTAPAGHDFLGRLEPGGVIAAPPPRPGPLSATPRSRRPASSIPTSMWFIKAETMFEARLWKTGRLGFPVKRAASSRLANLEVELSRPPCPMATVFSVTVVQLAHVLTPCLRETVMSCRCPW